MTILQSILLGIIQGLTEFLPISSSGHLVIAPYLMGWQIPSSDAFIFDVLVQVATLLAVFIYFYKDIFAITKAFIQGLVNKSPFEDPNARLGWYLILASLPAGVIGLLLKDSVEQAFASPFATALFLLITAALLAISEHLGSRRKTIDDLGWKDVLFIGFAQAIAIFPGISRSGATIAGGLVRDLQRASAARFSFLMSIPIMLAAGFSAGMDLQEIPNLTHQMLIFLPGFITAAVVGYLSIRWLLNYLVSHSFYIFSIYCTIIALLVLGRAMIDKVI